MRRASEARQYGRAVNAALDAVELDRGAPLPYLFLGRAYAKSGDPRKAIAALTKAARLAGNGPLFEANLAYVYARSGQRAKAERILDGFRSGRHRRVVSPIDVALVCVGMGETQAALAGLEDAFAARSARMINLNDPFFSELAGEPRYRQLLARMGLPSGGCIG